MNVRRVLKAAALLICTTGMAMAQTEWVLDPAALNFFKKAVDFRRGSPAILSGDYEAIGNDLNN
jgi:hypothetical protein